MSDNPESVAAESLKPDTQREAGEETAQNAEPVAPPAEVPDTVDSAKPAEPVEGGKRLLSLLLFIPRKIY